MYAAGCTLLELVHAFAHAALHAQVRVCYAISHGAYIIYRQRAMWSQVRARGVRGEW